MTNNLGTLHNTSEMKYILNRIKNQNHEILLFNSSGIKLKKIVQIISQVTKYLKLTKKKETQTKGQTELLDFTNFRRRKLHGMLYKHIYGECDYYINTILIQVNSKNIFSVKCVMPGGY